MKKAVPNLKSQIALLGVGLAARHGTVSSDIVVDRPTVKNGRIKNLAVRLTSTDIVLLDDLGAWSHQKGLRAGWGTILKAGLRMIRKDEQSLHVLEQILENDGRRRV